MADAIFVNRSEYINITNEEKEAAFFKINRKMSRKYPVIAKGFNNKFIDKASALDIWYEIFNNSTSVPKWWWDTKQKENPKKDKIDKYLFLMEYYNLKENDIEFLLKYFKEDITKESKKHEQRQQDLRE